MKKALFPGTFSPPSLGHLDIIQRAIRACDKLFVAIADNPTKKDPLFSVEEKKVLLQKVTRDFPQVEIISFSGLVVDFVQEQKIDFLIRGLRAFSDFEYEFRMALANRKMSGIETLFLMADERLSHISSTLIREVASYKKRLHDFVPKEIEQEVYKKMTSQKK